MGETGLVVEKEADNIVICLKRTEACAKCKACVAGMSSQDMILRAKNACGALVGDYVEVELKDGYFAKAVLIMYGFPFVMLFIGILSGSFISKMFMDNYNDLIAFAIGILFMLTSYLIIKNRESKKKSSGFTPVAVRISDKGK